MQTNSQGMSRRIERLARGKTSLQNELTLLGLSIIAGFAGIYFEDVRITCSIFLASLIAWLVYNVPKMMQDAKERIKEQVKEHEGAKAVEPEQQNGHTPASKPAAAPEQAAVQSGKAFTAAAGSSDSAMPTPEQVMSLIKARRSVYSKDFTGDKVPREQIEQLLEAANWAPTHNLTQPWRFVVLAGDAKARFEALTISCVGKYTQPAEKAAEAVERMQGKAAKTWPKVSHYIVICMSRPPGKGGKTNPEWEDMSAVACAVQNMHLLATSMGLAGYWSSWQEVARNAPEMSEFLGLNTAAGDKCLGVFSVGCSDRISGYRGSRTHFMEKVQWKSW